MSQSVFVSAENPLSAIKPHLDALLAADFRISDTVYQLALQQVGEA